MFETYILLFTLMVCFFLLQNISRTEIRLEKATFAGGCFWCMERPFEKLNGVVEVISGYTGGDEDDPTYEEVASGLTGHIEAIQIVYDPSKVSYSGLLDTFWRQIDPTDGAGQFVDRGPQYRPAIFYHNDEQKRLAEISRDELDKSGRYEKPIVTKIIKASKFYKAEDYHQEYHRKDPMRYNAYRLGSGRDQYLQRIWAKNPTSTEGTAHEILEIPKDDILKSKLTAVQYNVTQENGTESPFDNEYWDNKREGIYVDVVSGEPLFSSIDKYDSRTGWPSFTKALENKNIVEVEDRSLFAVRTEVRSKHADSHLGHVFNDGPPQTGLRYCMNSAALRFIPVEDLEKEGYGDFAKLFDK